MCMRNKPSRASPFTTAISTRRLLEPARICLSALASNNKSLAVLTLTDEGSRIVFSLWTARTRKAPVHYPGSGSRIRYLSDGRILALCRDALRIVKRDVARISSDYSGSCRMFLDGDGLFCSLLKKTWWATRVLYDGRSQGQIPDWRKPAKIFPYPRRRYFAISTATVCHIRQALLERAI